MSLRLFRILSATCAIIGVIMLGVSFAINPGPPNNATNAQLIAFGQQYYNEILWGAWLQAVGPFLIVLFALAIVYLAEAMGKLSGWMTMFGSVILMMVSLTEVTFYFSAMFNTPAGIGLISLTLIHALQHLYFIVAAPSLFGALGAVILGSRVLPRIMAYLAFVLGAAFEILGLAFLLTLTLPGLVLAFASVQTLWWLAAAIILLVRKSEKPVAASVSAQESVAASQ